MRQFKGVLIGVLGSILLPLICFSQENIKIEREVGIKERQVPGAAVDWLYDAFEKVKKPNWFQEFYQDGFSYEAKFKMGGNYYSVEFDSLGIIEDVEVELELEELDRMVQDKLKSYFSENYQVYKINKIQIQYTGKKGDLEDFFDENEKEGITVRYEIEYRGKESNKVDEIWEGTFTADGVLLTRRKIDIRITDNLIF
ncbi:hypothetical protein [Algoriphagus sp.]|uniref:hypothetical protein n=1 Tax=Algoriphagus sp. TaxID=1872435 RepID=UPI00262E4AA1|nr:hypothetical protein [Algoriphagus sp.]